MTKTHLTVVLLSACLLIERSAFAQHAGDSERADKLFSEANGLVEAGNFAAACPKFEESQKLEPALGTQFNLALCYEKVGKLGSAYRNLLAVERLAHTSGKRSREDAARKKREELAPRVGHLVLRSSDEDATVKVDGERVERTDWSFFAVDAGEHRLEATAPSKKPWHSTVTMPDGRGAAEVKVEVPKLLIEKEIVTTPPRRTAAYIAGGIGVAGIVASAVTGILVLDAKSTVEDECTTRGENGKWICDNDAGQNAKSRGETLLPINAIATAVGVVGLGVGSYLFFTSRKSGSTAARIEVQPYAGASGAGLVGRF